MKSSVIAARSGLHAKKPRPCPTFTPAFGTAVQQSTAGVVVAISLALPEIHISPPRREVGPSQLAIVSG